MVASVKSKSGQTVVEYLILFILIGLLVYGLIKIINDNDGDIMHHEEHAAAQAQLAISAEEESATNTSE